MSTKKELEKVDLKKVQYLFGKNVTVNHNRNVSVGSAAICCTVPCVLLFLFKHYHTNIHHYDIKDTVRSMLIVMAIRIYVKRIKLQDLTFCVMMWLAFSEFSSDLRSLLNVAPSGEQTKYQYELE